MAFKNIRLTPAQREQFYNLRLKNPLAPDQILRPSFLTVDNERKSFLLNAGAYHDLPEEQLFIFAYDESLYLFTIRLCDMSSTTKVWKPVKYRFLSKEKEYDERKLIETLREAMTVYKYNGLPDEYNQQFETIIAF